jgi:RNA-dependent RNA polymerase
MPLNDVPSFAPDATKLSAPAAYTPAPKKLLDRPSNMDDVAEFICEYITSDVSPAIPSTPRH